MLYETDAYSPAPSFNSHTPQNYIPDKYEDLHHKVSEAAKGTKEAIGNEISKIDDKIRSLNERLAGLHLAYQKVVTEFGEWL